jgi:hypothetical protein
MCIFGHAIPAQVVDITAKYQVLVASMLTGHTGLESRCKTTSEGTVNRFHEYTAAQDDTNSLRAIFILVRLHSSV